MRKKFFMLPVIMVLGMSFTARAENLEGVVFVGEYYVTFNTGGCYVDSGSITTTYLNDTLSGEFNTDRGDVIS